MQTKDLEKIDFFFVLAVIGLYLVDSLLVKNKEVKHTGTPEDYALHYEAASRTKCCEEYDDVVLASRERSSETCPGQNYSLNL